MTDLNLKELKSIMKLMVTHKIDSVEFNGVKICKSLFPASPARKKKVKEETINENIPVNLQYVDDEILFKSSSAPELSLADFNQFKSS